MRKVECSIKNNIKQLRKRKRILAVFMTICMVFSVISCISGTETVYAADDTLSWGDYKYRIFSDGKVVITKYTGHDTDVNVPKVIDGRLVIGMDDAFNGCSSLKSIELPSGITFIGGGAFFGCSSLTSINIPDSVTSIGLDAFSGCSSLSSITVSIENKEYDSRGNCNAIIVTETNGLLVGCKNTSIPDSVTYIGGDAFEGCSSLSSINIPDSVTYIGGDAFNGCSSLSSINIPDSVISIGGNAFRGCRSLSGISIPDSVTYIGFGAFSGCSSLSSINIPCSVTRIEREAFRGCSSLKSITVSIENKEYDSRSNCNAIIDTKTNSLKVGCENTVIPNSVTSIEDYAFYCCNSLNSINIPCSVTSIGFEAFRGCSSLSSINIPDSVTSIGDSAFIYCSSLKSITVSIENKEYDSRGNCNAIIDTKTNSLKVGCKNTSIPDSVTSIGCDAFRGCSSLSSINIPDSVTSIKSLAFYGCSSLNSIELPSGLTSIGCDAFDSGRNLIIYGYFGSEAEKYAKDNHIQFRAISEQKLEAEKIETYHASQILFSIRDTTSAVWDELEGAEVSIQEFGTATSDAAGHAAIDSTLSTDAMKTVQVRVHKEGFRDYFYEKDIYNKDANLLYAQTTDLIPMSRQQSGDDSNPYFSNVLLVKKNGGICDLLQTGWTYRERYESDEQNIQVNVEWNGKQPSSYELYQDSGKRCVSSDGKFKVNMEKDFTPKAKVYVKATATDGTIIQEELQLKIDGTIPVVDNGITLYEAETDENMGNDIPFLAGNKVSASMKLDKLTVSIDGDKIRIMIGSKKKIDSATGTSFDDNEWADWKKLCETQPKDLNLSQWKNVLESIDSNYTSRISAKSNVMGFLEGKLDASGNTVVTGCIKVTTNAEIGTESQYIVGVIPVYSAFSVGINGEIQGSLSYNFTKKELDQSGTKLATKIEPKLTAEGGIGVAAVAKVGAEGSGSIPFTVSTGETGVKMSLKGGLALKVKLLSFEYTHNIAEGEWELYPANVKASKSKQASLRAFSVDKFVLEDEEYTQNKWLGNFNGFKLFSLVANQDVAEKVLEQDIYEDTEIQLIDNGTVRMLLWIEHDNTRETINSSKLVYSVYDRGTDTWSAPVAVADDGTADFQPTVTYRDDKIYVAWVNANKVLQNTDSLTDMTGACGIVMSEWTEESGFCAPLHISEEDVVSVSPQMALKQDGKPYIVYVTNSANDLMFTSGTNDIVSAVVDGNSVSRIKLVQDAGLVTSLSVNEKDCSEVSYTKDKDGSLATLEDRDIVQLSDSGSFDTNNSVMDSNAQYIVNGGKSICFWYSERTIMMQEEGQEPKEIYKDDTLSDEFSLVSGKENEMAIIWTKTDEDGTKQIKGITYDAVNAEWSESVQISDTDANVYQPKGVFDSDGSLVISYKKTNTQRTDLCVLTAHKNCDLSLENAYCNESDLECGSTQHIAVQVKNEGLKTASSFKVKVADTETVISEPLLPGETKIVSAEYQVPDTITYGDVEVSVEEISDNNPDNNHYTLQIGNPDLEIKVDSASYSKGNLAQIRVANMNCVDTNAVLEVRADSLDGKVIDSVTLGTIGKGEVKELEYLWCNRTVNYSSDIQSLYFNVVAANTETYLNNNYDFIVVGKNEEKIPVTSIEITPSQIELKEKQQVQLTASILPDDATNKSLKWTTSDDNVATVNENGLVKAVGNGTVTITVEAQDGSGIKASCVINVSIDNGEESGSSGSEGTPGTGNGGSSDSGSGGNSETGNGGSSGSGGEGSPGTGNGGSSGSESEGSPGIGNGGSSGSGSGGNSGTGNGGSSSSGSGGNSGTGNEGSTGSGSGTNEDNQNADNKDENGQEDDSKVKIKIQNIILSKSEASLSNANTLQLNATIIPENATNKSLKWTTSDDNVATVNENGLVKAVGNGKVTITVEAQDGSGIKASCVLKVSIDNGGESTGSGSEGTPGTGNGGGTGSESEGTPETGNGGSTGSESEGTPETGNGGSSDSGSNTSGEIQDTDNKDENVNIDIVYYVVYFEGNGGTKLSRKKMTLLKDDCLGILPQAKRSKYNFDGWYTLKKGGKLIGETDILNQSSTLYAHWNKVKKPSKEKITKLKSNTSGQFKVVFEKKSNVIGYEISYSTNKKFTKAKTKTYSTTSTNVNIKKLKTGKKYYVKVRAYVQDSMGAKIFGTYSNVKSVKIR